MPGSKTVKNQLFDQHILSIEEESSNTITFIGHIQADLKQADLETLKGRDEWRISRITISGTSTITEWADGGKFTQIWDNREDIFDSVNPPFFNQISTDFDGINDFVNLQDTQQFDNSDAFAISMWVKPQNVSAQRTLFAKSTADSNVHGYNFMHNSSGQLSAQLRTTGGQLRSHTFTTLVLVPNIWQHVVFTYNGSQNINGLKAYLDTVVGSTPSSGAITNTWLFGQDTTIGNRGGNAQHFSGRIDEVYVYEADITPTEITEEFHSGNPENPITHSSFISMVSQYRMGDNDTFPIITDNIGTADGTMTNMTAEDFVNDAPA